MGSFVEQLAKSFLVKGGSKVCFFVVFVCCSLAFQYGCFLYLPPNCLNRFELCIEQEVTLSVKLP